jgi:hypothetical protein
MNKLTWTGIVAFVFIVVIGVLYFLFAHNAGVATLPKTPVTAVASSSPSVSSHGAGFKSYVDPVFGLYFEYPTAKTIKETTLSDANEFPGATAVKLIQIGTGGEIQVYEVSSPSMTITDEPNNHASPIGQTKYFFDSKTKKMMVAWPEGKDSGDSNATTTAVAIGKTNAGFPIYSSGRRFDTRIIALYSGNFVVISSNGGASDADVMAIARSVSTLDMTSD